MPHDHSHAQGSGGHHHHIDPDAGDARVAGAIAVNLLLTLAQIIGGIVAGSLSLIADALHNLSDAIALIIAFGARKIARRPADARMTFGYDRIEVVAALINYTTLIIIGLYLVYEAILRFFEPAAVAGWVIVAVAGFALLVDLITAALVWRMQAGSMNMRAAFLHNVADALGSVAVIVAGTVILLFGWNWVDPLVTLLIAGYILWQSWSEMPGVIRVLMLGSPPGLDTHAVVDAIEETPGVASAHHVHLWMMGENEPALDAHLVLEDVAPPDATRAAVRDVLATFDIGHSTLEVETPQSACADSVRIGHA
ncbi:cation diffusion facilitator family transporter [Pseudosulfitobacter koreensis]|uniref:Cation diffusion facilitator family transporter n=1 Tax=Pseudosulfitobacter koreensis TaxID=2968472 RepID=A0ABT1Z2X2_9RHOB|nr:cation diffusion facilitator family transporter [Pseudosulfitobacter koreense]MCR8827451.1 cation diffusion facilitator family transporter [Pseudosulfitobacter koreense]